jgi:hypothetical protein
MSKDGFNAVKNEIVGRHFTSDEARALMQLVDFHTIRNYKPGELPAEMLLGLFAIMHTYAHEGETLDELMVRAKLSLD